MYQSWRNAALGALSIGLLLSADVVSARSAARLPASPGYRGRDACPSRCSIAGPNPSNWSVYHNFDQFQSCDHTLFYQFSLYDEVDDPHSLHRISACTSFGADWTNLPPSTADAVVVEVNATYEAGWWSGGPLAAAGIRTVSRQMRQYLAHGYGPSSRPLLLFGQSGQATVGLYVGEGLQREGVGLFALNTLENSTLSLDVHIGALAMQLCGPDYDGDHVFGLIATSNGSFTAVQDALRSWSNAECLSFTGSKQYTGPAPFTTPLVTATSNTNSTADGVSSYKRSDGQLIARAECSTIQVNSGDSCTSLAKRCGISYDDFMKYHSDPDFCTTLIPKQHVCCSSGTLPDFSPDPNPDGSCATYTVHEDENCAGIAAANSITVDDIEDFNSDTWGWNGCSNLWAKSIICLSSGTPPMPAPLPNAVCGPQVPGTEAPTDGTDLADLNPCPLNACCDVFGQVSYPVPKCSLSLTNDTSAEPRLNSVQTLVLAHRAVLKKAPMVAFRTAAPTSSAGIPLPIFAVSPTSKATGSSARAFTRTPSRLILRSIPICSLASAISRTTTRSTWAMIPSRRMSLSTLSALKGPKEFFRSAAGTSRRSQTRT